MLRITKHDAGDALRLQIEGRIAGAWVAELEEAWRSASESLRGRALHVDLSSVDCVDAAGRYLLALMHTTGATFKTSGCMMTTLVQEITGKWPDCSLDQKRKA